MGSTSTETHSRESGEVILNSSNWLAGPAYRPVAGLGCGRFVDGRARQPGSGRLGGHRFATLPGHLPGEVHVDLLTAGFIPDPFDGTTSRCRSGSVARTGSIGRRLSGGLKPRPNGPGRGQAGHRRHDHAERPGGGVDGQPAPQLAVRLSDALVVGRNELEVAFAAPVLEAQRWPVETGDRHHHSPHPCSMPSARPFPATAGTGDRTSRAWASGNHSALSRGRSSGSHHPLNRGTGPVILGGGVEVAAERTGSGFSMRISAWSLIKDLTLFPNRIDSVASVDTALVTLQAGQSHTFQVTSQQADLDRAALTRRPVLRSANDLVSG
jgi:hypothetical protein